MFKPKPPPSSSPSSSSLIPLANGENDHSVFDTAHTQTTIRGKGLGLGSGPSAASQSSLKYQDKFPVSVSQKNALSDVNLKSVDLLNTAVKGISAVNREAELFSKPKQSFGAIQNCFASIGVVNEANAEIVRNAKANWDTVLPPNLSPLPDEIRVEPMIQNYYDLHGDYPEIEYITTNRPSYDSDWYYYPYPEMVPETFDRSFDSMDAVDIDLADLCLDSTSMASSFEVQLDELHFDSAFGEKWEEDNIHNDIFIPTDHPFFQDYSDDDGA